MPIDFETTQWSMVLASGGKSESAGEALSDLCNKYWKPVNGYILSRGYSPDVASELTQEFFLRVVEKNTFRSARPEFGRFRQFLKVSVKNFLINDWKRSQTQKRGVGLKRIDLDALPEVSANGVVSKKRDAPDAIFDREWALAVLSMALELVRSKFTVTGRAALFAELEPRLTGSQEPRSYSEIAGEFGLSESAVKGTAHRIRQIYREMLRDVVRQTLADGSEDDLEQELRDLRAILVNND